MEKINKYLYCYAAFMKKSRKKRPANEGLKALSEIFILLNLISISVILELIFGFKGIRYLVGIDIPFAPIGFVAGIIIFTPIQIIVSKHKVKREDLRYAVRKTNKIKKVYPILYTVFTLFAFFLLLLWV